MPESFHAGTRRYSEEVILRTAGYLRPGSTYSLAERIASPPTGGVRNAASYLGVTTVTDVTDGVLHTLFRSELGGHEQVVLCQDRATGLKAVIALHSTALGPALGGTRFYPYASEEEAVRDALNLSRGCRTRTPWPAWSTAAARP